MVKIIGFFALFILCCGICLSIFVFNKVKNGQAYQTALKYVEADEKIQRQIGKIEGYGFLVGAEIEEGRYEGKANLEFTVHGYKEKAVVNMDLIKDTTGWKVTEYKIY